MSAALHLAKPEHLSKLLALCLAFAEEMQLSTDETNRRDALVPLLEGSPHGAIYLIGPPLAPVGYIALSFGWSLEFGGLEGIVDELFIRPGVRGRGMASEVMLALPKALAPFGLKALSLEVDKEDAAAQRLYTRSGFKLRERYYIMSRTL